MSDALSVTGGLFCDDFARDRRTQLSVLNSVEIVGEAAAHMTDDATRMHRAIPWRDILEMRNRLLHFHFDIDLRVVWDTGRDDEAVLIARLEPLEAPEAG